MRGVVSEAELDAMLQAAEVLAARFHAQWPTLDADDLAQEARVAVILARNGFDRRRGVKFITYACPAVERRLWRYQQRERRANRAGYQLLSFDALDTADEMPEMGEPERFTSEIQARLTLAVLLPHISARNRQILALLYGGGFTLSEVGRVDGTCDENIRRREQHALRTMREALG